MRSASFFGILKAPLTGALVINSLKSSRLAAIVLLATTITVQVQTPLEAADAVNCDAFCHLSNANQASLIMLAERALIPAETIQPIAAAIVKHTQQQSAADAARSANYLDFEAALTEQIGETASYLHLGRSRQDLHETVRRLQARDRFAAVFQAQLTARQSLISLAERYADVTIPAYTHGVQAQPTSAGQYFLAFASAMSRDAERLQALYPRLNRSPLGAAALATSGFALDRQQLSDLLGFSAPVDNAYDANLVSSVDFKIEFAQALVIPAIQVGQLIENLHTQYHAPIPWMRLGDGQTSGSSIMPQKRNPRPLDRVRSAANNVIANANLTVLNAHNTNTGMNDYRGLNALDATVDSALELYARLSKVLDALVIDRDQASAELAAEYATMTEVADLLVREGDLPFRTAYRYASTLTITGRRNGKMPTELSDATLRQIFEVIVGNELPIDVSRIRDAMDPDKMVGARRGQGGPQKKEVQRMLRDEKSRWENDTLWLQEILASQRSAAAERQRRFDVLAN